MILVNTFFQERYTHTTIQCHITEEVTIVIVTEVVTVTMGIETERDLPHPQGTTRTTMNTMQSSPRLTP